MKVNKDTVRNVQVLSKMYGLNWNRSHMLLKLLHSVDCQREHTNRCRRRVGLFTADRWLAAKAELGRSIAIAEHYLQSCINNPTN